mgnify:CR=1 FL=1
MSIKSARHLTENLSTILALVMLTAAGPSAYAQGQPTASAASQKSGAKCEKITSFTYGFPGTSPTVGSASKLSVATEAGYYKDECLEVKVQFIDGSASTVQFIESGSVDAGSPFSSAIYQDLAAGGTAKAFYSEINRNNTQPQVLVNSDIKTAKDLIGKTVGISSLSSGSKLIVDMYIKSAGGDPAKDVKYVAVGFGAGAANFLTAGKVDAIALYDGAHAQISSQLGIPLRSVTAPEVDGEGVGFWLPIVATSEKLKLQRDKFVRFGRAFAKSYLLTSTNPECAVRLHWQAYPASRPSGVSESKAMEDALVVLKARMQFAVPDKRGYGFVSNAQVNAQTELLSSIGAIKTKYPAATLYTSDLIGEINDFDHSQIVKDAVACKGLKG